MKALFLKAIILVSGLLLAVIIAGAGCGKNPTDPPPAPDKDYVVYFGDDLLTNKYFGYHTKTGKLDSFTLPYPCYETGLVVSPDGSRLYLNPPGKIVEVATDSYTVIAEHSISINRNIGIPRLAISRDGTKLASCKQDLAVINLTDLSVEYYDTTNHFNPYFSPRYDLLYSAIAVPQSGNEFQVLHYGSNYQATQKGFQYGSAFRIVPDHLNANRWYIMMQQLRDVYSLQVYDVARDTILLGKTLAPGTGDMCLTPDGRNLFYSQPGAKWVIGIPPPTHFGLLDCVKLNGVEEISLIPTGSDTSNIPWVIGDICITPDGRRLIGANPILGQVFDLNISRKEYVRQLYFSSAIWPINLTCQTEP